MNENKKNQPSKKPYVAYYRVSTKKQSADMASQKTAVKKYLEKYWPPEKSFKEVESGGHNTRPELEKALAYCKERGATLIVAKLDRLSRDLGFIAKLQDDIDFVCCDMPQATRETIGFMAVIARWEREQIGKRTKDALAEKKKEGVLLGSNNPKVKAGLKRYWKDCKTEREQKESAKGLEKKIRKTEKARLKVLNKPINTITARALADKKVFPIIKAFRGQGYTYDKIAIALNKEGYKTRRGCEWSRPQVFRICQRNGL